ncbi:hypothetical protein G7046_g8817 [Stylonectria norvegica]|nr:hypothetical protein G7046_g8817 [Stylonectria norvegica]
MPPGRPARTRLVSNENDENSGTTRMTRAKAAALHVDELSMPSKGALQTKKSAVNANPAAAHRKRAALGDVSNFGKADAVDGKKGATNKAGLVSKAGVQKATRVPARATVNKDVRKQEVKRPGSGSGTIGGAKRRVLQPTTTAKIAKELAIKDEEEQTLKKLNPQDLENQEPLASQSDEDVKVPVLRNNGTDIVVDDEGKTVYPIGVNDLDSEDLEDPLMVAEYTNDIFQYLRELEEKSKPSVDYMGHQDDLEWKTRGILVDWLIEVHTRFHLLPETLFLAVNVIDRFLSAKVVQLDRLQLVGITAMFIASKYEEVLSPHVENFKRIADDGFSEAEILSAERFVLNTLDYNLSYPNPMNFLRRVSKADNYDIQSRTIGKYLTEISLLDHRFMEYPPSRVAAAAMYLARMMLDRGNWGATIAYYAGYTECEVEPVATLMVDYLARPVVHEAFFKKYASKKFLKASILARQWAKSNAPLFGITDLNLTLDQLDS